MSAIIAIPDVACTQRPLTRHAASVCERASGHSQCVPRGAAITQHDRMATASALYPLSFCSETHYAASRGGGLYQQWLLSAVLS